MVCAWGLSLAYPMAWSQFWLNVTFGSQHVKGMSKAILDTQAVTALAVCFKQANSL